MVLIILATLAVLGIALFASTQGLFSSIIMAILSVLAAAFALNFYEPAGRLLYDGHAYYADAVMLVLLFSLPLVAARFALDKIVPSNVVLNRWADRGAGGVVGLVTGTVLVGIWALALQLLPFGPSVLTYRPFDAQLQRHHRLGPFRPDDFVVSLGQTFSQGSLKGQRDFAFLHDNLLRKLFCDRNRAGLKGRYTTRDDALAIEAIYQAPTKGVHATFGEWLRKEAPPNPLLDDEANDDSRVVVFRVRVNRSAADEDDWWRLPATQFRLAWPDGRDFYPVAYLTSPWGRDTRYMSREGLTDQWRMWVPPTDDDGVRQYPDLAVVRSLMQDRESRKVLYVDWVFRLPAPPTTQPDKPAAPTRRTEAPDEPAKPEQATRPMYLAFRRLARVPVDLTKAQADRPAKGRTYETLPLSHALRRRTRKE